MRRTRATLIHRRTKNLRAVQLLLGHTKLTITVRYLGIEIDHALEMLEQTDASIQDSECLMMVAIQPPKLRFWLNLGGC